jgi:hypothetical protein
MTRGRAGTPAEVILPLLLKHMPDWSYEELAREVRANFVYRQFTRIGGGQVPDGAPYLDDDQRAGAQRQADSDGRPFAETREQMGGYFLIDAQNLDEATGIASRIPGARFGTVEIRRVIELAGLPAG